jgi:hypothetical protein
MSVGSHVLILRHPCCNCNTGCRRVTLYHPRPANIDPLDDWIVKAIARVRWGDGCGGPEVEVDWKHGVILDLTGCYDEVSFEIIEIAGTPPDEDNPYVVGVLSACCGAGAARGCATRTTAQVSVADDGTPTMIPIPPFAYAVQFVPDFGSTGVFFVSTTAFIQAGSGTGGILAVSTGDQLPDPWPLVNGAESLFVSSTGVALTFEVVFLIGV